MPYLWAKLEAMERGEDQIGTSKLMITKATNWLGMGSDWIFFLTSSLRYLIRSLNCACLLTKLRVTVALQRGSDQIGTSKLLIMKATNSCHFFYLFTFFSLQFAANSTLNVCLVAKQDALGEFPLKRSLMEMWTKGFKN